MSTALTGSSSGIDVSRGNRAPGEWFPSMSCPTGASDRPFRAVWMGS